MRDSQAGTARDALLASASRVFSERGFFSTRITDITTSAGVSAGSFYTYFESKEEILGAVMDRFSADQHTTIAAVAAASAADAEEWLRSTLATAVAQFAEHARMWRAIQQAALGTEQIRIRVRNEQDAVVASVASSLRPLIDSGLARPHTPTPFVARALVAMTEESLFQWYLLQGEPVEHQVAVDRLVWAWGRLLRLPLTGGGADD